LADYFLTTERLGFRCWRESDLPLAMDLWGDAEVSAMIGGPFTPEQVRARLGLEIARMADAGMQYWPIFLLDGDTFAGCTGLRPKLLEEAQIPHLKLDGKKTAREAGVLELGYLLKREHRERGLANEASRAVIRYGFDVLDADAIFAGHHPANEPSKRVLLKLGFAYADEEFYPPSGLMEPTYLLHRR